MRVTEQRHQEGIDVFNLSGIGVEQQNAISGRLEQAAVAQLGDPQRFERVTALRNHCIV